MASPSEFYSSKITEFESALAKTSRQLTFVSAMRLVVFLLLAFCIYSFYKSPDETLIIGMLLGAMVFAFLIVRTSSLTAERNLLRRLVKIGANELQVMKLEGNFFGDGADVKRRAMHADDLDVFGNMSIFHILNRTTTAHGKAALSGILNRPLTSADKILVTQHAVDVLAMQPEQRMAITAYGLLQEKLARGWLNEILAWIDSPEKLLGFNWINAVRLAMPVIATGGLLYYLSTNNPTVFIFAVIVNWNIIGGFSKYIRKQHELIGRKQEVLDQYSTIIAAFAKCETGESVLMKDLHQAAVEARQEIRLLSRLSGFFDQRLNLLVLVIMNSLFLYDIHVMCALESWKKKNKSSLKRWLSATGEIEMLNSLATFAYNHPTYTWPRILTGKPSMKCTRIGHPLIHSDQQVTNDFELGDTASLMLITGSNMSGKSTFLRTAGVNMLMAQCGLPVCAEEFWFTPMQILSSIRITDSLQENTSYFMAELKRLKEIIDILDTDVPAIILIDEVLRGTNSSDKTYGSEQLIKRLCSSNCVSFFATHDLALSLLENDMHGRLVNFCFESRITNGELLFDYKLNRGVAANKNASFLMKKMGIIAE